MPPAAPLPMMQMSASSSLTPRSSGRSTFKRMRARIRRLEPAEPGALAERLVADRLERAPVAVVADEAQLLADPDHDLREVLDQRRPGRRRLESHDEVAAAGVGLDLGERRKQVEQRTRLHRGQRHLVEPAPLGADLGDLAVHVARDVLGRDALLLARDEHVGDPDQRAELDRREEPRGVAGVPGAARGEEEDDGDGAVERQRAPQDVGHPHVAAQQRQRVIGVEERQVEAAHEHGQHVDGDDRRHEREIPPQGGRRVAAQRREQRHLHHRVGDERQLAEEVLARGQERPDLVGDGSDHEEHGEGDQERPHPALDRGQRRRLRLVAREAGRQRERREPDRDQAVESHRRPQHRGQRGLGDADVHRAGDVGEQQHRRHRRDRHQVHRDDDQHQGAAAAEVAGRVHAGERDQRDLDRGVGDERRLAEEVLRGPDQRPQHVDDGAHQEQAREDPQREREPSFGALPRRLIGGRGSECCSGAHHWGDPRPGCSTRSSAAVRCPG